MPTPGGRPTPNDHPRRPRKSGGLAAGFAILAGAFAAEAGDQHQAQHKAPARPVLSFENAEAAQHAQNHPECTCRAHGHSFQLGMQICMNSQMFRCSMDLNVTSWKSVGSPCPQS